MPTSSLASAPETVYESDDLREWSRVVSSNLASTRMQSNRTTSFYGRIRRLNLGGLDIVDMSASAHVARRAGDDVGALSTGYVLSLPLDGSEEVGQGRRTVMLSPGDFTLYDASRPFHAEATADFRCLNVRLSSKSVGLTDDEMRSLSAMRIESTAGLAPIVGTLIRNASETLVASAVAQPRATYDAARHTVTLIGDMLRGQLEESGIGPYARRAPVADVDRIIEIMSGRLGDTGLNAEHIAAGAFISLRQLHRLFHHRGESFADCLRRLRLERAAADLRSPELSGVTVADIGARWGFANPAHFSQTFRREIGQGPSEYRRQRTTGALPS
jgi:AraC-like DNA-binding protein